MNLDIQNWKEFKTSVIFSVMERGKASQQKIEEGTDCFYVGAKRDDNGIMCHCKSDPSLMTKGNCIVFICNGEGSVGYANYMDVDFIGTTDIIVGYSEHLNERIGIFLATIYSLERPKYSFGRKWGAYLKDTLVKLPAQKNSRGDYIIDSTHKYSDGGYIPDWQFMEDYIRSLHHKPLTTSNSPNQVPELNVQSWKEFKIQTILDCDSTTMSIKDELTEGIVPFISRSAENNGCDGYVDISEDKTTEGNCITLGAEGIYSFYQPISFATGNKVYQIRNKKLNKYSAMFIITILNREDYRYSYGRARILSKLRDETILLPATPTGEPDWQFMEDYIKSLPYGDRL